MKIIQWYPGHMTKARRMMEENIKLVDLVICVLDARAYKSCFSIEELKNKPYLYVLNKVDLIDDKDRDAILTKLKSIGINAIPTDSKGGAVKNVISAIKNIVADKINRNAQRGINKTVRAMIAGVPNSGKSTLINALAKGRRASVGDKAGITRGKQWVVISDNVELLDTPGVLTPKITDQTLARHLAYIGSINDDILDVEELAYALIEELKELAPDCFTIRYGIDKDCTAEEIFESIGRKRGYLLSGGLVDAEKTARGIIDDFRKQRLGKICLDK